MCYHGNEETMNAEDGVREYQHIEITIYIQIHTSKTSQKKSQNPQPMSNILAEYTIAT